MAYGASKQTTENAQRDLQNLDNKMAQRAITPQVYEEEVSKIRNTLTTVSKNAEKYAENVNTSKLERAGFPEETINDLSPTEKAQFASGYQPPKVQAVTTDQVATSAAPSTGQAGEGAPDYVRVSNRAPNKPIRTWQDYIEAQPTVGDQYEAERQFKNQHRQKAMIEILNQAQQVPPELRKDWIEQSRMMLDLKTPALADIRESRFFKVSESEAGRAGHLQNELTLSVLHNELATAKVLNAEVKRLGNTSEGKKKQGELITFLQANIPKVLQSIATGQSDAIQPAEATRLMPELKSLIEIGPTGWAELSKNRGAFTNIFGTDVDSFIQKSENIYKAGAGSQNAKYDFAHGKLGKAIEDTGLRRFNDTINPGSRAKSEVQDIQDRLKGFGVSPVYNQNPFSESQKPVMNQTGQSPIPSSGPPLKKGKVLNFGQSVKQVTNFQPLLGQD